MQKRKRKQTQLVPQCRIHGATCMGSIHSMHSQSGHAGYTCCPADHLVFFIDHHHAHRRWQAALTLKRKPRRESGQNCWESGRAGRGRRGRGGQDRCVAWLIKQARCGALFPPFHSLARSSSPSLSLSPTLSMSFSLSLFGDRLHPLCTFWLICVPSKNYFNSLQHVWRGSNKVWSCFAVALQLIWTCLQRLCSVFAVCLQRLCNLTVLHCVTV